MEAITIIRDKVNNHRLMQIDLDLLAKDEELLEAVYAMIALELRKNEKPISSKQAKQQFHKEGRLQSLYRIELKNPPIRN